MVSVEELAGAPLHHYCKSLRSLQAALGQMKVNKRLETSKRKKRKQGRVVVEGVYPGGVLYDSMMAV